MNSIADKVKIWVTLTRPFTIPILVVFYLLGASFSGQVTGRSMVGIMGASLLLVGSHFYNSLRDYQTGCDKVGVDTGKVYTNASLILPTGVIPAWNVGFATNICIVLSGCIFVSLDRLMMVPFIIGLIGGVGYSIWMKQKGLGELAMIISYGIGLPLAGFIVEAGYIEPTLILVCALPSLSMGLLYTIDQWCDIETDNVRNLSSYLQTRQIKASTYLKWGSVSGVIIHILLVAGGVLPALTLLALLAFPALQQAFKTVDTQKDIGGAFMILNIVIYFALCNVGLLWN